MDKRLENFVKKVDSMPIEEMIGLDEGDSDYEEIKNILKNIDTKSFKTGFKFGVIEGLMFTGIINEDEGIALAAK